VGGGRWRGGNRGRILGGSRSRLRGLGTGAKAPRRGGRRGPEVCLRGLRGGRLKDDAGGLFEERVALGIEGERGHPVEVMLECLRLGE